MISIRRLPPVLFGLFTLCAVLVWSHVAAAQISIIQEIPSESPRQNTGNIVSKGDCDTVTVDWTFSGITNSDNVSVWVTESTDCSTAINRTMDGAQCFDTGITFSGAAQVNTTETIALGDLLEAFPDVDACVDSTGVVDGRSLQIYFLVNVTGSDTSNFAIAQQYNQFDLVGTAPPTLDELVSADDTILTGRLSNLNSGDEIQNYKIYCERIGDAQTGAGGATSSTTTSTGGTGGTAGAGGTAGGGGTAGSGGVGGDGGTTTGTGSETSSAGGTDGTGGATAAAGCSSEPTMLVQGEIPPTDLERGTGTGSSIDAEGLDEGEWACGVAGTDTLGNPGVLSNILCATPEPVTDFFEAYRNAGGLAGGGFCQCSLPGADREHDWAFSAAAALALSILLRRKARERIRR